MKKNRLKVSNVAEETTDAEILWYNENSSNNWFGIFIFSSLVCLLPLCRRNMIYLYLQQYMSNKKHSHSLCSSVPLVLVPCFTDFNPVHAYFSLYELGLGLHPGVTHCLTAFCTEVYVVYLGKGHYIRVTCLSPTFCSARSDTLNAQAFKSLWSWFGILSKGVQVIQINHSV